MFEKLRGKSTDREDSSKTVEVNGGRVAVTRSIVTQRIRSFEDIESIDQPLKDAVLKEQERQGLHGPHNFIDSAEGSGPAVDMSSPQTQELLDGLDEMICEGRPDMAEELKRWR